jgi:hypothetical protein
MRTPLQFAAVLLLVLVLLLCVVLGRPSALLPPRLICPVGSALLLVLLLLVAVAMLAMLAMLVVVACRLPYSTV